MERGRNDSRDDTDGLKPLLAAVLKQNEELLAQVKLLLARIAELEARNGQPPKTPDNSSQSPSSGQKANVERAADKEGPQGPRRRRARAQRNPDVTRDVFAERCGCGAALSAADQALAHAYDHIDLPPIKPITTRINLHRDAVPVLQAARHREAAVRHAARLAVRPRHRCAGDVSARLQMISYARMIDVGT